MRQSYLAKSDILSILWAIILSDLVEPDVTPPALEWAWSASHGRSMTCRACLYLKESVMMKKMSILGLLVALFVVPFLAGCASTSPNSLSGSSSQPVFNDKGRIVGYQAR